MEKIITTGEHTIERIITEYYGATSPDDIKQLMDHVHTANSTAGHLSMLSVGQIVNLPAWPPAESPEPDEGEDKTDQLPIVSKPRE